jgi:hypothetical protein
MEADAEKVAINTGTHSLLEWRFYCTPYRGRTDTFSLELYRQVSAEIFEDFKVRLQASNQVYMEHIKNINFRGGKESLGPSPWNILSEQETFDSILAEFMNLAENGANTATGPQGGTVPGPSMQDSDSAVFVDV